MTSSCKNHPDNANLRECRIREADNCLIKRESVEVKKIKKWKKKLMQILIKKRQTVFASYDMLT